MILPIKKAVLSGFITLFVCFTAYAINQSFDFGDWSPPSSISSDPIHTCNSTTHTHETFVTYHEHYDKYIEHCIDKETRDYITNENYIYHDEMNTSDLNSSSHTINHHDSTTSLHDLLRDSTLETRRQEIEENQIAQIKEHNKFSPTTGKIICELLIPKGTILYLRDVQGRTFDSTIMLEKVSTIDELINALSSPIIKARFERIKCEIESRNIPKKGRAHPLKDELQFLDVLLSEQVTELLSQMQYPDLNIVQSAFDELKQLWPWKREHTFLGPDFKDGSGEPGFTANLGVNIMKIAEKSLITRPDYITKHTNVQEQKTIQECREKCYLLQQKGNKDALFSQKQQLYGYVHGNRNKNDLITNICLAIVENCYLDPITRVLHEITHAPSLKKSCDHLKNLELQLLTQAQQQNIVKVNQMRTWTIEHYGFDVLDAAQNCYKSRPDYIYTPGNQSYLSDTVKPILNNIKSKDLPRAHAELVHLEKQLTEVFKDQNIISPTAQKEYMMKYFGTNVLETAHKKYEARSDHKALVESFMAIDINQATATILENNNSYESVANEMSNLADRVFVNAHLCKLNFIENIENHIIDSLRIIKASENDAQFVFNVTIVDRVLTDIQQVSQSIVTGKPTLWERSPELLIRGFGKFFKGLNPLTQASNMGHLACDLGALLKKGGIALWNDPIATTHNGITSIFTLTELIRNTANFTSDLTVGKLYLSPEEYKQRTDAFCAMMEPLKDVTAEQYVDFVAQVAADILFFKGLGNTYTFLKEIDVLSKLGESTAVVTRTFKKGFDTHLANNPIVITAEGVTIKISDAMHNINNSGGGKNIINSSKALLESAYVKTAIELEEEIQAIRLLYSNLPNGFGEFSHKPIRIAYKHILGMEIDLSKKGKLTLSGFHQDFKNAIEKSGALKFTNKIVNKHGCYITDLVTNGLRVPDKTFFPAHWSRTEVISKIHEAYGNFIKSGVVPKLNNKGKYMIRGFTSEGIEIEMCLL